MSLRNDTRPLVLFRIHQAFTIGDPRLFAVIDEWHRYLRETDASNNSDELICRSVVNKFAELFNAYALCRNACMPYSVDDTKYDGDMRQCCQEIGAQIRQSRIQSYLNGCGSTSIAALLLTWPLHLIDIEQSTLRLRLLKMCIDDDMRTMDADTKSEIELLRTQIAATITDKLDANK